MLVSGITRGRHYATLNAISRGRWCEVIYFNAIFMATDAAAAAMYSHTVTHSSVHGQTVNSHHCWADLSSTNRIQSNRLLQNTEIKQKFCAARHHLLPCDPVSASTTSSRRRPSKT